MTNSAQLSGIEFEPMPKRFMVWDTLHEDWRKCKLSPLHHWNYVFDLYQLSVFLVYVDSNGLSHTRFKIFQSTNLFDEDGVEIFEGSLVQWGSDTGVVELYKGKWTFHVVSGHFNVYHELCPNADMVKVIGHILSNPELLEAE